MFSHLSIALFLVLVVFLIYKLLIEKRKNYPLGPYGLPILGNILALGTEPHHAFTRYKDKYGPIFSIRLGSEKAVIIHGAKLIKEAFNNPGLAGRPNKEAVEIFLFGGRDGIAFAEAATWSEQRRFALRHLHEFGFGTKSMESLIMTEVTELLDWIGRQNGNPVSLHRRFSLAVVNSLWTILSGIRYRHDDFKLFAILDQLDRTSSGLFNGKAKSLLLFFFPEIAKKFPNWSGWNSLKNSIIPRQEMFENTIQEHRRTLPKGAPRDFIDAYLQYAEKNADPTSVFHSTVAEKNLRAVMADFFVAGADTTSTTLNWAILYLIHNSEIQAKLQIEIDRVVGRQKLPCLADRSNLPYVEAFILEVLRISSIISIGVAHSATVDVDFHGFLIPKGTSVYGSLYATHHDPEVWGDPEIFRPERFLSQDGKQVQKNQLLIPFSTGKRVCIGERFAKDQLFLFTASLVQRFNIGGEAGMPKPSLAPSLGQLTVEPQHYRVVMETRN